MFAALVRVEHVVLLQSLSSAPHTYIGCFQILSFFRVFYPLSLFFSAGWPSDLCRLDTMMPIGPIISSNQDTHITPHPVSPRHQP